MNRSAIGCVILLTVLFDTGAIVPAGQSVEARVRVRVLNVRAGLYLLTGGGANTLLAARDDGVLVVDTKSRGFGTQIQDAIAGITDAPVTAIVHTHAHADHTGGAPEFGGNVDVIGHARTIEVMRAQAEHQNLRLRALADVEVGRPVRIVEGPGQADAYYFGPAHTGGDLVVVFPEARLLYVGDLFPAKVPPVADFTTGGSALAFPDTLARMVGTLEGIDRVATGHDPGFVPPRIVSLSVMTWADLVEYAQFTREFIGHVQGAFTRGVSVDEAVAGLAMAMARKYPGYDFSNATVAVGAVFEELRRTAP